MKQLFVFILLLPAWVQAQTVGTLKGLVQDSVSGELIPFAQLALFDLTGAHKGTAQSNFDGDFIMKDLQPGVYKVRSHISGYYNSAINHVEIIRGSVTSIRIYMKAVYPIESQPVEMNIPIVLPDVSKEENVINRQLSKHQDIKGTVTDKVSGEPLYFATLILYDSAYQQRGAATSDFEGNFVIQAISPGIYNLLSIATDYLTDTVKHVEVLPDPIKKIRISMEPVPVVEPIIIRYKEPVVDHGSEHFDSENSEEYLSKKEQRRLRKIRQKATGMPRKTGSKK